MKQTFNALFLIVLFVAFTAAQSKTNTEMNSRIKALNADKFITLTFNGNTSTIRAVSDNFSDDEAKRRGILAMNFALGSIYPGDSLSKTPDKLLLSFWVLTKKPKFGEHNGLSFLKNGAVVDLGGPRYSYKDRLDVEYLNFELRPDQIAALMAADGGKITLGSGSFTLTSSQKKIIQDILEITKVG